MTSIRWPLTHTKLVEGCLLLGIIILCFERAVSDDDGLEGVPTNLYRSLLHKVLTTDDVARARFIGMTGMVEVWNVSSRRCYADGCYHKFE